MPNGSTLTRAVCYVFRHKWLNTPFTDPPKFVCRRCGKTTVGKRDVAEWRDMGGSFA
jgi:hypothetical protein